MITKTIGGDRVGSGKKMQAHLHNYYRSTHNLNEKWASSMGSGILYPCLCKLGMRGDSFDISINADARTIPTKGPLFGSYKMQIDIYQCPVRLYQAILHNNPLAIGLKMSEVKFPLMDLVAYYDKDDPDNLTHQGEMNKSCLMKYLGLSGIGTYLGTPESHWYHRKINAIPMLAYYDIFKTYYANKQEDKAYVITPTDIEQTKFIERIIQAPGQAQEIDIENYNNETFNTEKTDPWSNVFDIITKKNGKTNEELLEGIQINLDESDFYLNNSLYISIAAINDLPDDKIQITIKINEAAYTEEEKTEFEVKFDTELESNVFVAKPKLQEFDLSNIDDMRYDILSHHTLGQPFAIDDESCDYPYLANVSYDLNSKKDYNKFALNGLVVKTYQNDIFNNWLNTDWIEGENGINEMSSVSVTDGKFSMDALNFAQKLYNMLNRIAVAGATYEDWQDVVYEEIKRRQIESPIFVGGMSQEIMFDEVIQTTPTDESPLGSLGGRGRNLTQTQKGGTFHVKCDEACFIIGIVSLTPRIFYTQGNEFYLTDVKSMDDIHKPAMDGIGFQDLVGERMAWWDTKIDLTNKVAHRSKIGKLPAWIEYMTSYDRAFGDFAEEYGVGYMILNRNYERDEDTAGIKDATTYIDPAKYNYAFAYSSLEAQNFWVEIGFNIKARRLMSARLIPNV